MEDTESSVQHVGWLSEWFPTECGVWQGRPFSPLLFIKLQKLLILSIQASWSVSWRSSNLALSLFSGSGCWWKILKSSAQHVGWLSEWFPTECGVWQGCTFSPSLFIVGVELLAAKGKLWYLWQTCQHLISEMLNDFGIQHKKCLI